MHKKIFKSFALRGLEDVALEPADNKILNFA